MKEVKCHNIKLESEYFDKVKYGRKTFEIRLNDRDYQEGDFVVLHEFNKDRHKHAGETIQRRIGFVTDYEQKAGYVVFSLLPLN